MPFVIVHGARPGPTVYLQAVSDGDELNGLAVARQVTGELDPGELSGTVVCVLVANPGALAAGQAADPRDGRKLNRCFPGQADGTVTERLAYALFHELALRCDLAIDLHQNGSTPMVNEVRVRTGARGPKHADCLELALAFGARFVLDQQGPQGQLARAAPARGVPTIDPELGGNAGVDPRAVAVGVAGVRRVLHAYGLLPGRPEPVERPYIARRLVPVIAARGGVITYHVELGERLAAGQQIATVTDIFGRQPAAVTAPCDGVFWSHGRDPMVSLGDTVATIGARDDGS